MKNGETAVSTRRFMENLLAVLPSWHYMIDKQFKRSLTGKMSLESYYCLQTLRRSGAITMSELADRLHASRQQTTQTVRRLCEYRFVRRIQDEADRRCVKIEITEQARDYIDRVYHQDGAFTKELERRIGAENMRELDRALEILRRVLPEADR